uniref:Uncharacterized protein n=1 Tax=Rhizophora mucronata TaxID=61149 RepID=A0A2P2PKK9_RHIMU
MKQVGGFLSILSRQKMSYLFMHILSYLSQLENA